MKIALAEKPIAASKANRTPSACWCDEKNLASKGYMGNLKILYSVIKNTGLFTEDGNQREKTRIAI